MSTSNKRYIKRVGPKGVTVWTWTEELAKRSDCFEISEREALHLQDPVNNPAPPNITNLQNLDPNLFTMLEGLTKEQQQQLMVLMGQVQHGQVPEPVTPATALDMSGAQAKVTDGTVGPTKELFENNKEHVKDNKVSNESSVNSNGRPSMTALNRMTKAQLQEHSATYFPEKPEFDVEDPNNTNDFMREKINEWWDEQER